MPDLQFNVEKAEPVAHAAAPLLHFALHITETSGCSVHAIALRCQIRIEPGRRRYEPAEQEGLSDLFGEPSRWGQTLRPMLWEHANITVPPFEGETTVNLPVPCLYDFNIAATKFFHSLEGGEVPLLLLFSGTVFYADGEGALQVKQIPWEKETTFRLPVSVWRGMMDLYYPHCHWLPVPKAILQRLLEFKRRRGIPTADSAIEKLLDDEERQLEP